MAFSFGTSGATPNSGGGVGTPNFNGSLNLTPASRALTTAQQTSYAPQAPTAPVASHTYTDAAGNTTKQTYDTSAQTPTGNTAPVPTGGPAVPNAINQYQPTSGMFGQIASGLANTAAVGSPQAQNYTGMLGNTSAQGNQQGQQITSNLANTSAASSPAATQYAQGTSAAGMLNPALAAEAQQIGTQYGGQISDLQKSMQLQEAANASSGAPVGLGRAGLIGQYGGQLMQGLSAAEQAALAGTSQQLTAAQQQANAEAAAGGLANTQQANVQSGLAAAGGLANTAQANIQSGLNSAAGQGVAQQQTTQSGLASAGQLAQPIQVPYSNQVVSPTTGQPVGGGAMGTLPQAAQDAVNLQIQKVQSGKSTVSDAENALSAYGQAGVNALQEGLGSNFNTNASNASAATTATGQQLQTAADTANKALDTLASTFGSLSTAQTGGIPLTNSIANWIGTQFGEGALTNYKANLADARAQLVGALNSAGGTPTGNEATALQYLPDNMTPTMFQQNVGTVQNPGIVRQLLQQKVQSFTQSGQQNNNQNNATGGSNSLYSF